jgi:hypothetical protein
MIRVTYHPLELSEADVKEFPDADRYTILEDNTLELREEWYDDDEERKKFRKVAHIHPDRWRDVEVIEVAVE